MIGSVTPSLIAFLKRSLEYAPSGNAAAVPTTTLTTVTCSATLKRGPERVLKLEVAERLAVTTGSSIP